MLPSSNKWVVPMNAQPNPRMRLFCFPYSGGAAHVYAKWHEKLPPDVEVNAIQYPGRSSRFIEPLLTTMADMVRGAYDGIQHLLDRPFALFGHSLGAAIAFEVCRKLEQAGQTPVFLFPSGRNAPHIDSDREEIHHLDEAAFTEEIRNFNGTPKEVLDNPELMELMVPILRADFTLSETYTFQPGPKLNTPMRAFGADADPHVQVEGIQAWGEYTNGDFKAHIVSGHHFFIQNEQSEFFQTFGSYLHPSAVKDDFESGAI